jgi:hypothetical protein
LQEAISTLLYIGVILDQNVRKNVVVTWHQSSYLAAFCGRSFLSQIQLEKSSEITK